MRQVAFCIAILLGGTVLAQSPPPLAAELRAVLDRQLEAVVAKADAVVGYAALDLTTGERIGRLDDRRFPTASSIKLAILYELFKRADEGRIRLDEALPLDRAKVVGGSGILHAMGTPVLAWRDYAVLMMVLSDNTATNVILDRLGLASVTARMQSLGLGDILLRRRMIDTAAALRGDENVATPRDLVSLLQVLHEGKGLSAASRDGALRILSVGAGGEIRRGVPDDVPVANKPGDLEGVRVDTAIVSVKNRPYALSVMTTFARDEPAAEETITDISRAFYGYYSRLATLSEYGRVLRK